MRWVPHPRYRPEPVKLGSGPAWRINGKTLVYEPGNSPSRPVVTFCGAFLRDYEPRRILQGDGTYRYYADVSAAYCDHVHACPDSIEVVPQVDVVPPEQKRE